MASIGRRARLRMAAGNGRAMFDNGPRDITNPTYLLRQDLGPQRPRILSGRGLEQPGYIIRGEQSDAFSEYVTNVRVLKMVSPLTGQGPASPFATGRYYGMDYSYITPNIVRVRKSVPPNSGYKVVIRPRTAIRRMNTRGQGTVGYY